MARNPNALKRANAFRQRVLEVIGSRSMSDRDAISWVADEFGYDYLTGLRIFRGYLRYRGEVCLCCHNPRRAIIRGGLCDVCLKRSRRKSAA